MRGRGVDFEHRFKTSRWAEDLLLASLCSTDQLIAVRFGLSEVRPEAELEYGVSDVKEPDLLVFRKQDLMSREREILENTDLIPVVRTEFAHGGPFHFVFEKSVAAIEVEFSPYRAADMNDRNWQARTQEQWQRRPLKHAKPPTAPNIFIKDEDLPKLEKWESTVGVPIFVVHLFDLEAFGVRLSTVSRFNEVFETNPDEQKMLQMTTGIFKAEQRYDRVDAQGAGETKTVFRIAPCAAIKVGDVKDVEVKAQLGLSTSGKYVSHVIFEGGTVNLSAEFLRAIAEARITKTAAPGAAAAPSIFR
jgi:hypothetical protein